MSFLLIKLNNEKSKNSSAAESFVAKNLDIIFNSLDDFILMADENSKIIKVNKKVLECTDFDESKLSAMKLNEIFILPKLNQTLGNDVAFILDKNGNKVITKTKIIQEKVDDKYISLIIAKDISNIITDEKNLEIHKEVAIELSKRNVYKEIFEIILMAAIEITQMDSGVIFIYNETEDKFEVSCCCGIKDTMLFKTIMQDCKYYGEINSDAAGREGIVSAGIIPIIYENRIAAYLSVASHKRYRISGKECNNLEILAAQLGETIVRLKTQESLQRVINYDKVTGLPNRTYFINYLNEKLIKCRNKLALLFLDIDNFRNINDTLGHTYGDILLKQAAGKFTTCMEGKGSAFRMGGDEYMFILPYISGNEEIESLAENIISEISHPFYIENKEIYISGSIGITVFPDDGKDEVTLLKNADAAMYYAKECGKNTYQFFTKKMNDKIVEKTELENSLRHALKNNEFIIHYQPQIDINSGKIIGMEALVRWKHPTLGIVPPLKFIPLAEETGLILPLGDFVLKEACKQTISWEKSGYGKINIAVNLSARQFDQKDLVEKIDAVLKETKLIPGQLEIEITESTAMKDLDHTIEVLKRLREKGVRISLDDFGTGYSSLNYLRHFPIDTIKIDKTFVNNITNNDNEKAVARAIITLAHNMQLSVVAEGVENNNQLNFLIDEQCDIIQGYLFSKPLSPEKLEELLIKYDKN